MRTLSRLPQCRRSGAWPPPPAPGRSPVCGCGSRELRARAPGAAAAAVAAAGDVAPLPAAGSLERASAWEALSRLLGPFCCARCCARAGKLARERTVPADEKRASELRASERRSEWCCGMFTHRASATRLIWARCILPSPAARLGSCADRGGTMFSSGLPPSSFSPSRSCVRRPGSPSTAHGGRGAVLR